MASPHPGRSSPSTTVTEVPSRRPLIVGLLLSVFAIAFQMVGILAALPSVMRAFDADQYFAWAMSTFVVGMLMATMVAGRLADQRGPMTPASIGVVLFTAGLVLAALAPSVWVLLLARVLQGLGAGSLNLSLFVVIALAFTGRERAAVMTWFSYMWLLPAFLGPPVAAALVEISWRLVFATTLPVLLVAVLLVVRPLRALQAGLTPGTDEVGRFPILGAVLLALGPVGLQLAGEGLGSVSVVAGVAGLVFVAIGLPRLLPPAARSFRSGLGPVYMTRAMGAGAFFAGEGFLILGLQDLHGLTALQAGVALTIGSLGWTVGSWIQSRSWVRLRRDQLITLGTALNALGVAAVTVFILSDGGPVWLVLGALAWIIAGFGMGILMPSTAVATMSLSQPWQQGRHSSALQVGESLGNAVLVALVGALYAALLRISDQQAGFTAVFITLVVALVWGVVASRRIGHLANESAG